MATVITVHGTYAHGTDGTVPTVAANAADAQWWQLGSTFEQDLRQLVDATKGAGAGKLEVSPFVWNGENSELARRAAGRKLLHEMRLLDQRNEPYCVIGHSHGGSVLGWALLESAAKKERLPGLKRWVTVGTPFVSLQREPLLFARLDLIRKVIFVASFMLLLMFLVHLAADLLRGGRTLVGYTFPMVPVTTGVMMSLPILVFYLVLKYMDKRALLHYRQAVVARAGEFFGQRWLSLTHTDDEAVQGLAFLPGAKLSFFSSSFAVPALTMLSVAALPLLYLLVLASPTLMVGIADLMRTHIYEAKARPEVEKELLEARQRLRELRQQQLQQDAQPEGAPRATDRSGRRSIWREYRETRRNLNEKYPDIRSIERNMRFKQRFFEERGQPCEGGKLCGGGRDLRINSGLLLHLVTDEISSAIAGEGAEEHWQRWISMIVVPGILVPILFGLISLLMMLLIRRLAHIVSHLASKVLNSITNSEVKRAAFGNDTEGEIATAAVDRPLWIGRSPSRLPVPLADLVTDYSNGVASNSLAKFRRAIGQLASQEPKHTADSAITTYFTWKELVHASYFDVPEFRKLLAQAVSQAEGFAPSQRFQADPDFQRTAQWLAEIEGAPGTPEKPGAAPPTAEDAEAVSAVVASTVKAEP